MWTYPHTLHFHFFIGRLPGFRIPSPLYHAKNGSTKNGPPARIIYTAGMERDGRPFCEIPFVAADVETTGLDPGGGHRICEIALLRFHRGTVVDSLVSFVDPLRPISPAASAVNGITDRMVAGAPRFADLYPSLVGFLGEDPLVLHNAPFDLSFLRHESRRAGARWPENRVIDTLAIARGTRRFREHSLSFLCGTLGIGSSFHRAAGDAYAAGKLLIALWDGDGLPEPGTGKRGAEPERTRGTGRGRFPRF